MFWERTEIDVLGKRFETEYVMEFNGFRYLKMCRYVLIANKTI